MVTSRRLPESAANRVDANNAAMRGEGLGASATPRAHDPAPRRVIVSRHPAAVAFIQEAADLPQETPALSSATKADVTGAVVYGNLPLHLAAHAECVVAVEFDGEPPRGAEYSVEDMRAAGARLRVYTVKARGHLVFPNGKGGMEQIEAGGKFRKLC